MKIGLITNVTAVGSRARAECDFVCVILDTFLQIQAAVMVGEPLCDLFYLGSFNEHRVVGYNDHVG